MEAQLAEKLFALSFLSQLGLATGLARHEQIWRQLLKHEQLLLLD